MNDQRNAYGYPVDFRVEKARQYAEQVRQRNKTPCTCAICVEVETLPKVQQITENWRRQ